MNVDVVAFLQKLQVRQILAFDLESTNLDTQGLFLLLLFQLFGGSERASSRQLAAMQLQKSTHYPFPPSNTPKKRKKGATAREEKEVRKAHFPFPQRRKKRGMRKKGKFPFPLSLSFADAYLTCIVFSPQNKTKGAEKFKANVFLNKGLLLCVPLKNALQGQARGALFLLLIAVSRTRKKRGKK